jgi:hypothetical protein
VSELPQPVPTEHHEQLIDKCFQQTWFNNGPEDLAVAVLKQAP